MLMFNYDEAKSQSNQVKHGIDFIVAQRLWKDPDLLEIPAKTQDEPRYLVIGRIAEKHWSARAHTYYFRAPVPYGGDSPI